MATKSSEFPPLFRPAAAHLGRKLTICAVLGGVTLLGGAQMQAQSDNPTSSTTPAPTAAPATAGQRPDSEIAGDLNKSLMANDALRPLNLGIWVHGGTVTLSGYVPNQDLKSQAEAMVRAVAGVKNVEDQITIGAPPETAPGFSGNQHAPEPYPDNSGPGGPGMPPPPPSNGPQMYGGRPHPGMMLTVTTGAPLYVMVMQTIDSHHAKVGMQFHGVLVQDVIVENGVIAIPRGADVMGTIIDARGPGHLKGRPKLALQLTGIDIANSNYPLTSYVWSRGGPGKGGQSAANIGGGAAAGAIIGGAVGGGPTALLGAALGGLGSAGLTSLSSGPRLIVPAESVLTFYLNTPLTVREPTMGEIRSLGSRVPPSAYGPPPGPGYGPPPGPGYGYPPPPPGPPGGYPY